MDDCAQISGCLFLCLYASRDLAQNWDVDIASSLEDYLEDLEEITITLDGGASKVNFAEAALLIQVLSLVRVQYS